EHRHRDGSMGHDLAQLLALSLDRLVQQRALRDVARDRLQSRVARARGHELRALSEPEVLAARRRHRELAVAHRDALLALVLVEAPRLVAVVGADEVEEGTADERAGLFRDELARRRVRVLDPALGVDPEDDVARSLDQLPEARVL